MTDQPSGTAETAPDHAYAEEPARVMDSAAFESSDPSDLSAPTEAGDRPDTANPSSPAEPWSPSPAESSADPSDRSDGSPAVSAPPAGSKPAGPSEPEIEPTGVPEVDALLSVLGDLDVLPIEDHAQVLAEAHQRLHQALLSADEE